VRNFCVMRGSVAANIDIYLLLENLDFFLQLQLGPTDLRMVVPRNDAIFRNYNYIPTDIILADTDLQYATVLFSM